MDTRIHIVLKFLFSKFKFPYHSWFGFKPFKCTLIQMRQVVMNLAAGWNYFERHNRMCVG